MAPQPSQTELDRRAAILDELMRSHRRELRGQAYTHSAKNQNVGDALDDAAVAFLRFYKGGPGDEALRYMLVCVRTAAWEIDRRRRLVERHDQALFFDRGSAEDRFRRFPDHRVDPQEQIERLELTEVRKDLLAQLKPDERTAIAMFAYGFSYEEIGRRKGWTYTKVNRCLAEGRERLRELLAAEGRAS